MMLEASILDILSNHIMSQYLNLFGDVTYIRHEVAGIVLCPPRHEITEGSPELG